MINLNSKGVLDMAKCNDFKWLVNDINSTLVLKVVSRVASDSSDYGTYCIQDILENDWDKLNIKTANIDDLTNLLTLGIVRFVNMIDSSDMLDIPFRNLYKLYESADVLGVNKDGRLFSFQEIDAFAVIDGVVRNDLLLSCSLVNKISEDLNDVMKIAYNFGKYGMQEKFDALTKVTLVNHRRLMFDNK